MPEDRHESSPQDVTATTPSPNRSPSRRLLRWGIVVTVVVVLLGLVLFYAPSYVARHLIAAELDALGIDHEGVETLTINPVKRELWLGPVRFSAGPADPGQLGELGLTVRFNPLLDRRVSIERLAVRGIDLYVTHGEDKALLLNGIPLSQILPPPATAEQRADEADAWGVGVDTVELRDSRLVFQDRERGDVEIEVERLTLADFQSWTPDSPGRFELAAQVNDIELNWIGEARPFADNITLAIDSRTQQADVPKVVRFTGPWGLERQDGTYDAELKYQMTLYDSGQLEGQVFGTIDIAGADYERAGVFSLALERARVDLDLDYSLSESGDFTLAGQVVVDLGAGRGGAGEGTRLAVASGRLTLDGLDASYAQSGALDVRLQPDIILDAVDFSGPIEISVDKMLELLALLQALSATGDVSIADTGLGDYADNSMTVPSSDVKLARLVTSGESLSLRSIEGQVGLDLKAKMDLSGIQIAANQNRLEIERLQSALEQLSLTSGGGQLALRTAGNNVLAMANGEGPRGEFRLGGLEASVRNLGLQVQSGAVAVQLAAASKASDFIARIYAAGGLPEVDIKVGAVNATLGEVSLDAVDGGLRWAAAGDAAVDVLTTEFAKTQEGALQFKRAAVRALQTNERLQFVADAASVDGLDLYFKRSLLAALLGGEQATGAKAPAKPPASAAARQPSDVRKAQTLLTQLGYAPGTVDGLMGPRTAAAIREFQRREGLAVDGRVTAGLLAALDARASGPPDPAAAPKPVQAVVAGPTDRRVRVGEMSLTGSSVIRFRDDIVTPQVNINTVFKEARVRNLDTQKTDRRTELRLEANINEFTHVELAGWIRGFSPSADLDLNAKVENLELSTYSPYVVELSGVYLESGQLDTTTSGQAAQGALQGEIQLRLDDIAFRPLSKQDAERMAGQVGVPLETAVGLLQDDEGRIDLTLPLRGTLDDPQVEVASAVNKAIGGALKKVFPPTMIASLMSGVAKGGAAAFEPIAFAAGSAELDDAGRSYANDVAEFLAEHPKLSLKVCGRSTALDMEHLVAAPGSAPAQGKEQADNANAKSRQGLEAAQVLEELAIERGRTVRRHLIEGKGTDAGRVPECRSTFVADDEGPPRVEITL